MVQRYPLVLALLLMMVWGGSVAGKGKPKVSTLAKCPPSGAEARGGARGLLNEVKHHVPQGTAPAVVLIEEASVIQRILRHLGLPIEIPEPRPARAPPLPLDARARHHVSDDGTAFDPY